MQKYQDWVESCLHRACPGDDVQESGCHGYEDFNVNVPKVTMFPCVPAAMLLKRYAHRSTILFFDS